MPQSPGRDAFQECSFQKPLTLRDWAPRQGQSRPILVAACYCPALQMPTVRSAAVPPSGISGAREQWRGQGTLARCPWG